MNTQRLVASFYHQHGLENIMQIFAQKNIKFPPIELLFRKLFCKLHQIIEMLTTNFRNPFLNFMELKIKPTNCTET